MNLLLGINKLMKSIDSVTSKIIGNCKKNKTTMYMWKEQVNITNIYQ